MSKIDKLKEIIRELIKQELEEVSTSAATPGYQTPYAFSGGRKKDKKKKKKIATNSTGFSKVNEGRYLPLAAKEFIKALKKQDDKEVIKYIEYISDLMDYMKDTLANKKYNESVNEGKYHDYRNDESMTPKQKIGRSMRDVRNSLSELSKVIDMNVRLKKELKVNSQSYWKNTHKALHKISERLVKLANKVGQLQ